MSESSTPVEHHGQPTEEEKASGHGASELFLNSDYFKSNPSLLKLISPIEEGRPAGEDARRDSRYEALRTEMRKLEEPSGELVQWSLVSQNATELLESVSKDYLVVSYLICALLEHKGLKGLLDGIICLEEIVRKYWDEAYPSVQRLRARTNAFAWLADQLEIRLNNISASSVELEHVEYLESSLRRVCDMLNIHLKEDVPSFSFLFSDIQKIKKKLSQTSEEGRAAKIEVKKDSTESIVGTQSVVNQAEEKPEEILDTVESSKKQANTSRSDTPLVSDFQSISVLDEKEIKVYLKNLCKNMIDTAMKIRANEPFDPLSFRLMRSGLYLSYEAAPNVDKNELTFVTCPSDSFLNQINSLEKNEKWEVLIGTCESALPRNRFFLNLHRLVAHGLKNLERVTAYDAVVAGVLNLVRRMPTLLELKFANGTPFADEKTREWIRDTIVVSGSAPQQLGKNRPVVTIENQSDISTYTNSSNDLTTAAQYSSELQNSNANGSEYFRARLELARKALDSGALGFASATLSELFDEGARRDLRTWEPSLYSHVCEFYYRALVGLHGESSNAADITRVYTTWCSVDPAAALRSTLRGRF